MSTWNENIKIRIQLRFHNFFGPNNELVSFQVEQVLWEVSDEVRASRLRRFVVPREEQSNFESEKLWSKVSEAIAKDDQVFFFFRPSIAGLSSLHGLFYGPAEGLFKAFFFLLAQLSVPFLYFFLSRVFCIEKKEKKWKKGSNQHLYMNPLQKFWFSNLYNV